METVIRRYLLLSALFAFGHYLHAATYVLFLRAHGLNFMDSGMVNVCFFATLFLFEIPTGVFADVFGRKRSFLVAAVMWSIGLFIYGSSDSFWGFGLAETILAIGATFQTGAFQAWMVDSLKHLGYEDSFEGIFSREQRWIQAAGVVSVLTGSIVADRNMHWPWFIGSGVMGVVFVLGSIVMKEEYFTPKRFSWSAVLASVKANGQASVQHGLKNKVVLFLLAVGTVQFLTTSAPNMQWSPFYQRYFPKMWQVGAFYVTFIAFVAIGNSLAPRFLRLVKDRSQAILLIQALVGIALAASGIVGVAGSVAFFMLHEVGRGMFRPIKDAYLHDHIPSSERATMVSFESLSHHVGGVAGLIGSGYLAQAAGVPVTWLVSGGILAASAALLRRFR